jgi:hypothetical protein
MKAPCHCHDRKPPPGVKPLPRSSSSEPIVAWRGWRLVRRPRTGQYRLMPLAHTGRVWPMRTRYRAICEEQGKHEAPDMWGSCGSYSVKDVEWAMYEAKIMGATAVGTVALWGTVIEHENGYRAEFAYPQRLRLVCEKCLPRWVPADRNGVVIRTEGLPRAEVRARCPKHIERGDLVIASGREVQDRVLEDYAVDLLPVSGG